MCEQSAMVNGSFKRIREGVYEVTGVNVATLNSIRRIILAEIPNVAFDTKDIILKKNTGNFNNEFLAHRISMIPIWFDPENDTSNISQFRFVLNKRNDTTEVMDVTSKDIRVVNINNVDVGDEIRDRLFPANKITNDHILITKLLPNPTQTSYCQEIDLEMTASFNIAKTHARWCPVSKCSYMNAIDSDAASEARKAAPVKSIFDSHTQYKYYKKNIYGEPCEFEFYITTECAMTPDYLLRTAFDILKSRITGYLSKSNVIETSNGMFEVIIQNEDFTLVNLLHSIIYDLNIREASDSPLDYIGYYQTHPLEKRMVLKIHFGVPMTSQKVMLFLEEQNALICDILSNISIS